MALGIRIASAIVRAIPPPTPLGRGSRPQCSRGNSCAIPSGPAATAAAQVLFGAAAWLRCRWVEHEWHAPSKAKSFLIPTVVDTIVGARRLRCAPPLCGRDSARFAAPADAEPITARPHPHLPAPRVTALFVAVSGVLVGSTAFFLLAIVGATAVRRAGRVGSPSPPHTGPAHRRYRPCTPRWRRASSLASSAAGEAVKTGACLPGPLCQRGRRTTPVAPLSAAPLLTPCAPSLSPGGVATTRSGPGTNGTAPAPGAAVAMGRMGRRRAKLPPPPLCAAPRPTAGPARGQGRSSPTWCPQLPPQRRGPGSEHACPVPPPRSFSCRATAPVADACPVPRAERPLGMTWCAWTRRPPSPRSGSSRCGRPCP